MANIPVLRQTFICGMDERRLLRYVVHLRPKFKWGSGETECAGSWPGYEGSDRECVGMEIILGSFLIKMKGRGEGSEGRRATPFFLHSI